MGYSRTFVSLVERGVNQAGPRFIQQMELLDRLGVPERDMATTVRERPAHYYASNAVPHKGKMRQIPVYTFVQAGQAVAYEELPEIWDDTIEYDGNDEQAFALRVAGDSMSPNFPPGTIITVSPRNPPNNGSLVVAKIKEEGVLFKMFHHTGQGDDTKIILSSYNQVYPTITLPREKLHWIYRVTRATQNL